MEKNEREQLIQIPLWAFNNIERTLEQCYCNITERNKNSKYGESCLQRNLKGALNTINKLKNNDSLTGLERIEK